MTTNNEQLRSTLYDIGTNADTIPSPASVYRLIEVGIVRIDDNGHPRLTAYGEKCFVVMESAVGEVPELNGELEI